MRMKPEHLTRLCSLMDAPHLSLRSQFILVRRIVRNIHAERQLTRAHFAAEVKKAEAGLPFTQNTVTKIKETQDRARKSIKARLSDIGTWLYQNDQALTARYGFDGICDLLEVNPVHRAEVIEYAEDMGRAVSAIAFVSGYEESASQQSGRRPADSKEGPLFFVFLEMMMKAMSENRASMPDPFAPGAPLHGLPTYHKQPDGTLARKSASLVVHSPDGSSRVVERKLEKARDGALE
ncbi:hypothetical protein QN382_19020 [Pseudomonas sp. 10B1]|uniref:hypothetical protein n=1 Tax=unclassified Pseudomonas TaxID=196821 RepID=UPI002B233EB6|nr:MULTISPECIES: hypothetical protein [unclassified Pseudomonas]MEA9994284.1 hypothetical protein [Pseudomonas sp. AA4]MEB0088539.1 hypothetical protein [Pseudomonas sp. RTI1]MEB0126538.1 hypothetical protein [Pseudomonas sp. CCC1.2]MEB0154649.1 hypothetical protein [Pseudomonas sp. CCC4.3]MEB0221134.1 hypothetical protein [Pseudomonas sp. AB12(2023)]